MKIKTTGFLIVLGAIALALLILFVVIEVSNRDVPVDEEKNITTQNVIKVGNTNLGSIMTGLNGMSLYIFRADTSGESTCYGTCAEFWPPLLVDEDSQPVGDGITATLGVTERTDNTYQVTANGMPLYFYAGDSVPGDTNGQGSTGAGALWYVLSLSGTEITAIITETPVNETPAENEVFIINFSYMPSTITIDRGETIIWINKDSDEHSVTSDSGRELNSSFLSKNESYSHTFNRAGTYSYHCTPHLYMKGTVIVKSTSSGGSGGY